MTPSQVLHVNSILARSESRVAAHRRLGTRTDTLQVLACSHTLALSKVLEEDIEVSLEADDVLLVGWQEREDSHLTVGTFVHIPSRAGEFDTSCERDRFAVGAPCTGV